MTDRRDDERDNLKHNDLTRDADDKKPEPTATDPEQPDGYFDSSMGYASEGSVNGNLNPFPYRGPGSSTDSRPAPKKTEP